jgi:peptidyl-prolyl cis-trans isomerase SurA
MPFAKNIFGLRYSLSIIVLTLGLCLNFSPAPAQTLGIAAVVNDDVISLYDLEARIKLLIITSNQKDTPDIRRRLSGQILNRLINEKLKMQEAKRLGVRISKKKLENAYADMEKRNSISKGGLTDFLNKNGIDQLVLLDQIEATLAWAESVNRTYRSQISVSEEEIDEIVNEIKASKGKPEYLAGEIFLSVNNPNLANEVLNNANRLIEQMKKGADFGALARNYSQSATAAVGGDLGWVRNGQLPREINKVLISLKKGNVSAPIRTVAGYHLIVKRNERTGQGLPPSKEKLDLRQVFLALSATAPESEKAALTQKALAIKTKAASCSDMENLEAESGSPMSGSLGVVDTSSLPTVIQNAVRNLPVGTASQPIPSDGGIIMLMVCKRTGTSSLEIVRSNIKLRLRNERLDISARGHLRDLRHAAFLDIRR